jgi:hypothetical protein
VIENEWLASADITATAVLLIFQAEAKAAGWS